MWYTYILGGESSTKTFEEKSTVSNQLVQVSNSRAVLTATGFLSGTIDDRDRSLYSYQMDSRGNRFDLFDYPRYLNNTPVTTYYYYGNIDITTIEYGCKLMYDGYSQFTFRKKLESNSQTSLSVISILSEACEDNNYYGNFSFTVNSRYFLVFCDNNNDDDVCQIYEVTYDIITYNSSSSDSNNYNSSDRRRLAEECGSGGSVYVEGKGQAYCSSGGMSWDSAIGKFLFTGNPIIKIGSWLGSLVGATGNAIQETAGECYYAQSSYGCPAFRCCPDSSCFAGSSIVEVLDFNNSNGKIVYKQIKDIEIGDQVLTMNKYGEFEYSDVYMNGHKISKEDMLDSDVKYEYIYIKTESNDEIIATRDHFIHVCENKDSCSFETSLFVSFENVIPYKHFIFVTKNNNNKNNNKNFGLSMVVSVTTKIEKDGIYNPYTLNGNIVVNNVVASCHSSWIVDKYIPITWRHYMPNIYQTLFAPVRYIYYYFPHALTKVDLYHPYGLNDVSLFTVIDSLRM